MFWPHQQTPEKIQLLYNMQEVYVDEINTWSICIDNFIFGIYMYWDRDCRCTDTRSILLGVGVTGYVIVTLARRQDPLPIRAAAVLYSPRHIIISLISSSVSSYISPNIFSNIIRKQWFITSSSNQLRSHYLLSFRHATPAWHALLLRFMLK
jgi:hypothetical protein